MVWDITMYTYWNCPTSACHFFPLMRDGVQNVCGMRDRSSPLPPPPPPSASFATLYQHSPIRLILRGSPTRSRTLGTRFMDPTKPPTHPNSHRLSAEKRSPLRLSRTCLTILHPFAKPEMKVIQFFRRTAIRCVRSSGVRLFAIFSSFLHFKSVIMSLWPREIKFKPRIKLGHNIVSHVEILPRGNNNTNMCKKLHCR